MMKTKVDVTLRLDWKLDVSLFNLVIYNKCDVFMIPFIIFVWHGLFYSGI
jgi:hypothetical protein